LATINHATTASLPLPSNLQPTTPPRRRRLPTVHDQRRGATSNGASREGNGAQGHRAAHLTSAPPHQHHRAGTPDPAGGRPDPAARVPDVVAGAAAVAVGPTPSKSSRLTPKVARTTADSSTAVLAMVTPPPPLGPQDAQHRLAPARHRRCHGRRRAPSRTESPTRARREALPPPSQKPARASRLPSPAAARGKNGEEGRLAALRVSPPVPPVRERRGGVLDLRTIKCFVLKSDRMDSQSICL